MNMSNDEVVQAYKLARRFRDRIVDLTSKAKEAMIIRDDEWDPYAWGYYVLGDDDLLLTNLELVYFIIRYDFRAEGTPLEDYDRIIDAMRSRRLHDEASCIGLQSEGGSDEHER